MGSLIPILPTKKISHPPKVAQQASKRNLNSISHPIHSTAPSLHITGLPSPCLLNKAVNSTPAFSEHFVLTSNCWHFLQMSHNAQCNAVSSLGLWLPTAIHFILLCPGNVSTWETTKPPPMWLKRPTTYIILSKKSCISGFQTLYCQSDCWLGHPRPAALGQAYVRRRWKQNLHPPEVQTPAVWPYRVSRDSRLEG